MIVMFLALSTLVQPAETKIFGDWIVGCDNGRACTAVALMSEDGSDQTLSIDRGPEASALPVMEQFVEQPETCTRYDIYIDGQKQPGELPLYCPGSKERGATDIPAMLRGKSLEYRMKNGEVAGRVSLKGMAAALLYMDEQQGRAGTVTALVAKGAKPAEAVPPPPSLPQIQTVRATYPRPPSRLHAPTIARWKKAAQCDAEFDGWAPGAYRLDDKASLILVPCWRGAYNEGQLLLIARRENGTDAKPAGFDFNVDAQAGDGISAAVLSGVNWDKEDHLLSSFSQGRGVGDCGSAQNWTWDGSRFRLVKASSMDECRGSMELISRWRAAVVPSKAPPG